MKKLKGIKILDMLTEHDKWVKSEGEKGKRADFRLTDLRGLEFEDIDLSFAIFDGADLYGAEFTNVKLYKARFNEVHAPLISFKGSDLSSTHFYKADLEISTFDNTDLNNAFFKKANLYSSVFRGVSFKYTDLSEAITTKITVPEIFSIDNIGTFNGKVTYVPQDDIVFAGCWRGSLDDFLIKGIEMNKGRKDIHQKNIINAYTFFKANKEALEM